jgi:HEXXH motif-containing protein
VFVDAGIELLDGDAYPELSGARSPDERPSPLAPQELAAVLERGVGFLAEHWPAAIEDVRTWLRGVIAITAPGTHVYSASAAALPLIVKLTARTDESPPLLAETLVHETAHGKLESLWDMAPLLANDDAESGYHHPWRPDPRPLRGVFLAAHAFGNVMLLYRNAVERGWAEGDAPHEVLCAQVTTALGTLEQHATFTTTGLAVFERLRRLV